MRRVVIFLAAKSLSLMFFGGDLCRHRLRRRRRRVPRGERASFVAVFVFRSVMVSFERESS